MLNLKHFAPFDCLSECGPSRPFAKAAGFRINFRGRFSRILTSMRLSSRRFRPLPFLITALLGLPGHAAPTAKSTPAPGFGARAQAGLTVQVGDPKRPGWLLAVIRAGGFQGDSGQQGFLGNMTRVSALLYKQGKPAATFTAPRARGSQNNATKNIIVTGTGGVVVKSLTEPGTTLTADTVVWYPGSNQVIATGHVVYHKGKSIVVTAPVMYADTRLKAVHGGQRPGDILGTGQVQAGWYRIGFLRTSFA